MRPPQVAASKCLVVVVAVIAWVVPVLVVVVIGMRVTKVVVAVIAWVVAVIVVVVVGMRVTEAEVDALRLRGSGRSNCCRIRQSSAQERFLLKFACVPP